MSQENVAITRALLDAFNRGDLDWVARFHDPEIEWTTSSEDPDATTHRGRAAVRRYFEQWMESFAELHADLDECVEVSGGCVLATYHFHGRGSASGVDMDWRLSIVYRYREGSVVRAEEYFDRADALEAVGLSE
jgi:ketosteroid isomerase-like protein